MERAKAKTLGAILESSVGEVPFIEAVSRTNSPLWSHKWMRGKKHGPAIRIVAEDGGSPALLLVMVEWLPTRKGDWYLIGVSEAGLGTTEIELHHVDPAGGGLVWRYSPKKRDGRNDERMRLFAAKYPQCKARVTIPTSIEAMPILVEEIQNLVRDRRRADDLRPLRGSVSESHEWGDDIEAGFPEGEARERYVVHRHRERRLRRAKINEVMKRTGCLACEVCEFDFKVSFGELGDGFAHVHHKIPLGTLKKVRTTRLDDLAIVCANCHAMIHVGGKSRELDEVRSIRDDR
jgi:hypothetical protein